MTIETWDGDQVGDSVYQQVGWVQSVLTAQIDVAESRYDERDDATLIEFDLRDVLDWVRILDAACVTMQRERIGGAPEYVEPSPDAGRAAWETLRDDQRAQAWAAAYVAAIADGAPHPNVGPGRVRDRIVAPDDGDPVFWCAAALAILVGDGYVVHEVAPGLYGHVRLVRPYAPGTAS